MISMRVKTIVAFCVFSLATLTHAATLFQTDDFEDGTTNGWAGGAAPTNIVSGGPVGKADAYLQVTSNGTNGPGSKLATSHDGAARTGDYRTAGVQRIAADFRNPGVTPYSLRAVLVVANSNKWTSTDAVSIPADGTWHRAEFSLLESELTLVGGALTYDTVIQGVDKLLLRHDEGAPSNGGTTIAASLGIDNVQLLPGGDFDNDGIAHASDIDALVAAIAAANNPAGFDLNGDAAVDAADLAEWLRIAGNLNLGFGQSYLVGDADLDGSVDGQDFIDWSQNKFTDTPAWTAGDFDANGQVDGRDFLSWNANKFESSVPASVPEPRFLFAGFMASLVLGQCVRQPISNSAVR